MGYELTLAALLAYLGLLPRVYDVVQVEVLLPLEALQAHGAHKGSVGVVAQLVPLQVFSSLQPKYPYRFIYLQYKYL